MKITTYPPSVYTTANYAEKWWRDACGEIPDGDDNPQAIRDAVRRQIIFAVCALESWFFEWVRDDLLDDLGAAEGVFANAPWPLRDKIKCVLGEMHARGILATEPGYGTSEAWSNLKSIIDHRNGLVHALASRPAGSIPPDAGGPTPTPEELLALGPNRPLEVVRGVVILLTSFANAEPPEWMTIPD